MEKDCGVKEYKILFICLGNICRSPAAEEVMRVLLAKEGLGDAVKVDSAGLIAYHEGELPDSRMRMHAYLRGYSLRHRSRPIRKSDFKDFDMIIGMDGNNVEDLTELAPDDESRSRVFKMTRFLQTKRADSVPDPYYGGTEGFELVLDLLEDSCSGLLAFVRQRLSCR